ncbi:MAG: CYTH domain-containing protein [Pseudomonadota bacterium]
MTETELKFRLEGAADAARLEAILGEPVTCLFLATRYWLPSAPAGVALRLREVGGATEATVKRSGGAPMDGLFVHDEQSELLDAGAAVAFISGERPMDELPLAARAGLQGPFRYVGIILTRRHLYRVGDLPLEVDRVTFPNGADEWELEVETPDAAARRGDVEELAGRAGISLRPSVKTKLGRLLDRLAVEELA